MKIYVKCCQGRHDPIELSDGVPVVLGRSPLTKIADKKCSREQIELTASYVDSVVHIKQLGANSSYIGDRELCKGESTALRIGEVFNFFGKEYPHVITKVEKKAPQKRTIDSFFGNESSNDANFGAKRQKISHHKNEKDDCDDESKIAQKLKALQETHTLKKASSSNISNSANSSTKDDICVESTTSQGWSSHNNVLFYYPAKLSHSSKIAAFDMDGTLITTASGKTFAKDTNDWKILYTEVPGKLKQIHRDGYKIVIVTNQLGIGKGKISADDFKRKVENILKLLGVPIQVIAVTKRGAYRKPNIGVWTWLQKEGNGNIEIDMVKSYYVGDAAGRPKDWAPKKKKDFSCTDRLFAINLGIEFKTPEEYFLSHKPVKFVMPEFDPKSVLSNKSLTTNGEEIFATEQEVVVLVGYPASGKSYIANDYFVPKGYVCVNRDTMKTWQKCVAACSKALSEGKSVVVDNTNPDTQSRHRYIACANSRKCKCRCFVLQVSMDHARHNNRFRELSGSDHDRIPDMVFYQHRKIYQEPTLEEGFSAIVKTNFVPKFKNDELKKKYYMYND